MSGLLASASRLRTRVCSPRAAVFVVLLLGALAGPVARAEIRIWVDDAGVTHFSDDPERAPDAATSVESEGAFDTLRSVWDDGLVGPPITT